MKNNILELNDISFLQSLKTQSLFFFRY